MHNSLISAIAKKNKGSRKEIMLLEVRKPVGAFPDHRTDSGNIGYPIPQLCTNLNFLNSSSSPVGSKLLHDHSCQGSGKGWRVLFQYCRSELATLIQTNSCRLRLGSGPVCKAIEVLSAGRQINCQQTSWLARKSTKSILLHVVQDCTGVFPQELHNGGRPYAGAWGVCWLSWVLSQEIATANQMNRTGESHLEVEIGSQPALLQLSAGQIREAKRPGSRAQRAGPRCSLPIWRRWSKPGLSPCLAGTACHSSCYGSLQVESFQESPAGRPQRKVTQVGVNGGVHG